VVDKKYEDLKLMALQVDSSDTTGSKQLSFSRQSREGQHFLSRQGRGGQSYHRSFLTSDDIDDFEGEWADTLEEEENSEERDDALEGDDSGAEEEEAESHLTFRGRQAARGGRNGGRAGPARGRTGGLRNGTGGRRMPGDWSCPKCQKLVYASRMKCFSCGEPKPQPKPQYDRPFQPNRQQLMRQHKGCAKCGNFGHGPTGCPSKIN